MPQAIFVSYSQADQGCAYDLVTRLEADGIACWIAPRDITPGSDWAAEIIDAIAAARLMVLVFSASSNESSQVHREVERAVHKRVQVLPFRIDDVQPSKSLEYFLSSQHWMDAFPRPAEHYARLSTYLKTQLSGASRPGAALHGVDLKHIELQLAYYVGPLAGYLVKQAASQAGTLDELVARLSTELDTDRERRDFRLRCRQSVN
jgi:TIR domain